jgi:hypothetical protein
MSYVRGRMHVFDEKRLCALERALGAASASPCTVPAPIDAKATPMDAGGPLWMRKTG